MWQQHSVLRHRKVLDKGTSHVLAAGVPDEQPAASRGWDSKEPPGWAKELFQQQAEILKKLNNLPQPEERQRERKQGGFDGKQTPRGCYNCGCPTHFKRDCPNLDQPADRSEATVQGNGSRAVY